MHAFVSAHEIIAMRRLSLHEWLVRHKGDRAADTFTTAPRCPSHPLLLTVEISCSEFFRFGSNAVSNPSNGRNEHTLITNRMLVPSASFPNPAEAMPAIPKAKPKNRPAMAPTLPGSNSV